MPKGSAELAKTHCPQGHLYDVENTRMEGRSRHCRQCLRESDASKTARAKQDRLARGIVWVPRADRTHCRRGHAYDEANTRIRKNLGRTCRACDLIVQTARDNEHPERMMWGKARARASAKGVPFSITPADIVIPSHCPVLGIPLVRKVGRGPGDDSPSLDRIEAAKGYVPGNIVVISLRANRIKNDATLEELERVTAWLRTTMRSQDAIAQTPPD